MKRVASVILLLFVAVSVIYLIVAEVREPSAADPATIATRPAANSTGEPSCKIGVSPASELVPGPRTIVYYFHGTMRCPTCLRMERYAREAVAEDFAAELDAGRVEWQPVNYDDPANEHFVQEYGLSASALVVVSTDAGSTRVWRNLDRIWNLSGDEYEFKEYVVEQVTAMLRGGS